MLILRYEYEKLLYAGPQATLANSRMKYWTIGQRNITREYFRQTCDVFQTLTYIEAYNVRLSGRLITGT